MRRSGIVFNGFVAIAGFDGTTPLDISISLFTADQSATLSNTECTSVCEVNKK